MAFVTEEGDDWGFPAGRERAVHFPALCRGITAAPRAGSQFPMGTKKEKKKKAFIGLRSVKSTPHVPLGVWWKGGAWGVFSARRQPWPVLGGSLQGSLRPAEDAALPRAGQRCAEMEADQCTWYRTADGYAVSASGPRMPNHKEKHAVAQTSTNHTPMR